MKEYIITIDVEKQVDLFGLMDELIDEELYAYIADRFNQVELKKIIIDAVTRGDFDIKSVIVDLLEHNDISLKDILQSSGLY